MKLYRWKSIYLKQWQHGEIIAMAADADAARILARRALEVDLVDRERQFGEEDEDRERHRKQFERDIAAEPEVIESGALLIYGSS